MRENRQSGSEGGETFGLPYPYPGKRTWGAVLGRPFAPPQPPTTPSATAAQPTWRWISSRSG